MTIQEHFGATVRRLRLRRRWTQEELASRAKKHWTYIGGIERGERNVTLAVIEALSHAFHVEPRDFASTRPQGEAMTRHPVETLLNADATDILNAIQRGFRCIVDVKGKLAEYFLERQLDILMREGFIEGYDWFDQDGKPDFEVRCQGQKLVMECKNLRSSKPAARPPQAFKVELQKTRNSKDGTPTRGYTVDEFDILAVCLFNQTQKWDYRFIRTEHLARRDEMPNLLKVMQPVPIEPAGEWKSSLKELIPAARNR